MTSLQSSDSITLYGGGPDRDKDGNVIPERHESGCGCLVYPAVFILLAVLAWYAIKKLS